MTFTKEQLTKAFEIWNDDYLINPTSYQEIKGCENPAELQAERLLEILSTMYNPSAVVVTIPLKPYTEYNHSGGQLQEVSKGEGDPIVTFDYSFKDNNQ